MHHYQNLLYISHGTENETEGLKQALSLARNNQSPLKLLVMCPSFPNYQKKYEDFVMTQTRAAIKATSEALKISEGLLNISIELMDGDKLIATRIIQSVLRHDHDLVIKEADSRGGKGGFKAIDMELLRKCPVPVWLCRPIKHSRQDIQVAVAIDPDSAEPAARDLSIRMLELSNSLAASCSGELHIVSCWNYEMERSLRANVWVKTTEEELNKTALKIQHQHRSALDNLVKSADFSGTHHIHHLKGEADELIPSFVTEQKIDILVMGTVARTGIPGFMFGNTAENIVQNLTCSLMALKPNGFVSTIKAY